MSLKNKFKEYFVNTGVTKRWFANRIGMHPNFLHQIIGGYHSLPRKYWFEVVEVSRGLITLKDILEEYFNDSDGIEVEHVKYKKCIVILKKEKSKEEDRDKEKLIV
jgi:hypothetical protein